MDKCDKDFFEQVKRSCEKHNTDFYDLEFTISQLTNWIQSIFVIKTVHTAKNHAIRFSALGYLVPTNKGFKFNKSKLGELIR